MEYNYVMLFVLSIPDMILKDDSVNLLGDLFASRTSAKM
jgi:hypothetical protein